MIKFNQTIFIDIISLLVVILELVLLVNIFPQTGLSRIIYIPFWIIVCFLISIWLTKKNNTIRKKIISLIIFHLILFHLMLWSWPQSSAIQKNLINEFYGNIYR
jgi:hypothetical protein